MRILFLILSLFVIKSYLYSQVTFNKTIDFTSGDETAQSIVNVPDGYIIAGHGYGYETEDYLQVKLKFAKIDLDGNTIWQRVVSDSGFNLFCDGQSGTLTQEGNVIFGGSRQTDTTSEIMIISLAPPTGDTLFYKIYSFSDFLYGTQVRKLSSGEFIMLGFDYNASSGYLLIKFSTNGDLIWSKSYGVSTETAPSNFEIDSDDKIWLINKYLFCSPPGSIIREIDSSGTIISQEFIPDHCLFAGQKSVIGGFYGPGGYYPIPPYQTFTYRMDASFNLTWINETEIDFDTLESGELYTGAAKELPNGDLISIGYYAENESNRYIGIVSKIDKFGNSIWERYYTCINENFDSRTTDLNLTLDNGILITGVGYSEIESETQNFWVLKLDSMGCLFPGCDTLGNQIYEVPSIASSISIYPNPVITNSLIRIETRQNINKPDSYELIDALGNKVKFHRITNNYYTGNAYQFILEKPINLYGLYILNIYSEYSFIGSIKVMLN